MTLVKTPSRTEENFRYTQIPVPTDGWQTEKLSALGSDTLLSPLQSLGHSPVVSEQSDFYNFLFADNALVATTQVEVSNADWQFFISHSTEKKTLGKWNLRVKKGQSLKILEEMTGSAELSVLFRSLYVEAGAKLEYFLLQELSTETQFVLRHFVHVEEGGELILRFFHHGGARGQHRIHSEVGKKALVTVEGATRLADKQHVDVWVETLHTGAEGRSETAVWNVLTDEASAVFNGMIRIVQNCPQTQAFQSNKSLLLSEKTRVYTLPKLQIATDDVKCSHGASVSSLDDDQLFYLKSRGISEVDAQKMLITAFTEPVLQHLPVHYRGRYLKGEEQ